MLNAETQTSIIILLYCTQIEKVVCGVYLAYVGVHVVVKRQPKGVFKR